MEIDHVITDAAKEALRSEAEDYAKRLSKTAVDEAFKSRGKPIEVTASDVVRAANVLRADRNETLAARLPRTSLLLQSYLWIGILTLALASILPMVLDDFQAQLTDSLRVTLKGMGFVGLFMAGVSLIMQWQLRRRVRRID